MILPILQYASDIWGLDEFSVSVFYRACRFYLGVGKYTPNNAVMGEWDGIFHFTTRFNQLLGFGVT